MEMTYGLKRVAEPQYVLPTSAWKLDNSRNIYPNELRISVRRIHLEGTSFKQICTESNYNEEKIKQKIIDIIIRRGKLHNPVTDTGGLAFGTVEEIGEEFYNPQNLKVGDTIICNASLASVPIQIENILAIDHVFNQIDASGYAILHDHVPIIKIEEDMPVNLLLYTLDESGTLYRLSQLAEGQSKFLIVGNNMITNLIFGYVIRRQVGAKGEIVCLLDKKTGMQVMGDGIDQLIAHVFNEVHFLNILKPIHAVERLKLNQQFDLSVNCAEIPGAETINILATKAGGTVLFANLINNLKISLYITESISKPLNVENAEGYLEDYETFDIALVRELADYFENAAVMKVESAEKDESAEASASPYDRSLIEQSKLEDFVCVSRPMRNVLREIANVSKYDCNVIIFGDTGVGKEKVANLIQKNSDRKMQPFVKINCGAISPNLIESEFFGYEKGAFTGANTGGKKGYFEIANNGVMFLDEIGELPLEMQVKLLRVLESREVVRIGGNQAIPVDVRIISATNQDLEEMAKQGKFREDLYYRLNVVRLDIPPLRERPEDIPPLSLMFINRFNSQYGMNKQFTYPVLRELQKQVWRGNVRELKNTIENMFVLSSRDYLQIQDLPWRRDREQEPIKHEQTAVQSLDEAVADFVRQLLQSARQRCGSTRQMAAELKVDQSTVVRKMKKYGLVQ